MYKVIAFDLDGTLVDSLYDIANCMNEVLKNNDLPTHEYDAYKYFIGEGAYRLVEQACNNHVNKDDFFKQYQELALSDCTKEAKEFPNVSNTLHKLKENYKLALITNKPLEQGEKVINEFFPNIFDFVLGQVENREKKPNRAPMDELLSHYNIKENDVLYIGDSHIDFQFAQNCNVDVLILTYGYSKLGFMDELDNEYKIDNFEEILNKI